MTTRVFRRVLPWLLMLVTVLALAGDEKIRLAIMEVEDTTGLFRPKALQTATDLLRTLLTQSGKYLIIDKGQQEKELKEVLKAQKKESRKECYDKSCQIELGQALSADTLLRSQISKLGKSCTLSSEMIDIGKEAGIGSGVSKFDCTEDGLATAIEEVAAQLTGVRGSEAAEVEVARPVGKRGPKVSGEGVKPSSAALVVKASPAEAVITVTGPKGYKKTVRGSFNEETLVPGTYKVIVEAEGYEPEERSFELGVDDVKSEKLTLQKPGNLEVTGEPKGAKVEIEGPNNFSVTQGLPVTVEGAYRGEYQIKVSREGYGTVEKRATVKPGETARVEVKLQKGASAGEVTKGDDGIEWVSIPGGTFEMGCSEGDTECASDEKPRHNVTVRGFRMMKYEVTQGQYRRVMGENPSGFTNCGENCPVEQVDWNQSKAFCEKIGGRLPTEEEWEYAARGGTRTKYYCGNDANCLGTIAWYDANSGNTTHPVGQKRANAFGLFDMSGNVWEWTGSCYSSDYNSSQDCSRRVIRGGSWNYGAGDARSSNRNRRGPSGRNNNIGLRCGRD